jgi:hypothetical protein
LISPDDVKGRLGYSPFEKAFTAEEHEIFVEEYCRKRLTVPDQDNPFTLPIRGAIASKLPGRTYQECIQHYHMMKDFMRTHVDVRVKKKPGYKDVVKFRSILVKDDGSQFESDVMSFRRMMELAFEQRDRQMKLNPSGASRKARPSSSKSNLSRAAEQSECTCQSIDAHCSGTCGARRHVPRIDCEEGHAPQNR